MENELSTNSTKTDSMISCEVFTSFESLEGMQEEWDHFVESVGGEIFLTYDWCRIWWKYYGEKRDLKVFIFRDNKMLVGIIPIFFEKIRLGPIPVKAAKIVGSDFTLTQFSPPLADGYIRPAVKKFYELVSKDNCDIIHIGPIAGLYDHCNELKNILTEFFGNSHFILIENNNVQTYFQLADDWEGQLAGFSKNARKNIKHHYGMLNEVMKSEAGNLNSHFATNKDFDEAFEDFVQMHQLHWQMLGKAGHFGDWPDSFGFHRELAKTQLKYDRLCFLVCTWGHNFIGYEYGYILGNKYFAFLNSRSNSEKLANVGLGTVIFAEVVKKALDKKLRYIDAMRGKYEHKLRLGGKLFPIKSIYVIPRKISVRLRVYLFRLCARLLNLCYYRIWFGRLAPKLPFKRRPLWKIWIRSRL